MRSYRPTPSLLKASGLVAAFLAAGLTARGQAPATSPKASETPQPAGSLTELQQQIQALSAELRDMRAEVKGARSEAAALSQELGHTRDELTALKNDLAATRHQTASQATVPSPAGPAAHAGGTTEDRVSKIEEEQQLLSAKVDDQYQSKVESGSKYRVRLSGMALFNAFTTRGATDSFDLPQSAVARDPLQPNGAFGATLRQSILGLDVSGPEILGAKTSADIRADFAGGFTATPNGVTAGLVRLRTAGLRLDWQDTSVVAGQYTPFFSPLSPSSLASVAYPALASSGNLWVWTPQVYVEHRLNLSENSSVSFQGGILDGLAGESAGGSYYRYPQAGERSGQPAYAARMAWTRKSQAGPLSVGVGGYYERQSWGYYRTVDAWAATADWSLPLSHWLALTGEFYHGRALGGLGAAGEQSIATTGPLYDPQTVVRGLNSTGGWAQLKFIASEKLEFNSAFGEDFSIPPDVGYSTAGAGYTGTTIGRNESAFFNSIYHLRSNLMFSVEYRRLRTAEAQPGLFSANQVSVSAATLF
ncbi:MAG TPA: hypothetical protein VL523_02955 [Terriglobia bacterium]|nr:hypothetical protein [Terriglobia bacterium]